MKKIRTAKKHRYSVLDVLIVLLFVFMCACTIYPFWHCIVGSFMTYGEYMQTTVLIWPRNFTLEAYDFVFSQGKIFQPMLVTTVTTLIGTFINLFMTTWMAYGLTKNYPGKQLVNWLIIITMFLSAGLIPNYMLFRKLKLLNTIWVYIVPYMINTFYLIVLRTNFSSFPHELEESAAIDGAGDYGTFFRIVLPLSTPVLATIALFTAVDYWNTYQQSVYYVSKSELKTLQDYLYMMLSNVSNNTGGSGIGMVGATMGKSAVYSENIKLANTVVAVIPILLVYPFLQKYFTSGLMVGALKG